ncbi:LysR family transcriptional regulator [Nocardia harenae]|uniref:LysR family transcriptional regulator n=1 Tax=Nocardia harenae TaxID=358707 RepID=UPI00147100BB|nr:LysR family transcriptional regulator [Nocardia harenae]
MEIFHLRYFVTVADELNFSRAAARLNISPSPLSQRIKDLENAVGTTLFSRTPQYVRLTAAGQALLPQARDVVERFDALQRNFARSHSTARLRVGVAPDVGTAVRQRVSAAVRDSRIAPGVRFVPGNTAELTAAVRAGALDLALVHGVRRAAALRTRRLASQPVGVALSAEHPLAGRDSVALEDLRSLAWATINHLAAPSVYGRTDALLARYGVLARAVVDGTNVADLLHLVLEGTAFALVGLETGATRKAFLGEPVVILPVRGHELSLPTDLIWRPDSIDADSLSALLADAPGTQSP